MQLWFIRYDNSNGDNLDLFVEANSPADAVGKWNRYYGGEQLPATVEVMNLSNAARDTDGVLVWNFQTVKGE